MRKVVKCWVGGRTLDKRPIYHVRLDDGTEGTSLDKFEVGDNAQAWFDDRFNKIKITNVKSGPKPPR